VFEMIGACLANLATPVSVNLVSYLSAICQNVRDVFTFSQLGLIQAMTSSDDK
jgi:Flp pilus assembly pilin Flp